MKLEVGKYYRTRDGRKVGPIRGEAEDWRYYEGAVGYYKDDGIAYNRAQDQDLIAEWTDTPEVGTLKEIGAKVGDVVQRVGYEPYLAPLTRHEIETDTRGGFRIISRAQPSPVRTVTTTRYEIVPGVYGKVRVHPCGDYTIDQCTADELTSAIQTLTAIRDAMQASATA